MEARHDTVDKSAKDFANLLQHLSKNPAIIQRTGIVEWHCSLCDSWSTSDLAEAKAHYDLMNVGKTKESQWFHRIYPVPVVLREVHMRGRP